MNKIKRIIAGDVWWYIARVLWCALPIGIIISRCDVFEVFLFIIGSLVALDISHEVISQEIKRALDSGHISIHTKIELDTTTLKKEEEK